MKILKASEMQTYDRETFSRLQVPARVIMENAGRGIAMLALQNFGTELSKGVCILAGSGNNAGDGYVAARALLLLGYKVKVIALKPENQLKGDARANAISWKACGGETFLVTSVKNHLDKILACGLLIDAVFGTGFVPPARDLAAEFIELISGFVEKQDIAVLAIDVPSGLSADSGNVLGSVLPAKITAAIQCLKHAHVFFPAAEKCGQVFVVDAGIDTNSEVEVQSGEEKSLAKVFLLRADKLSDCLGDYFKVSALVHKGEKGKIAIFGGSTGMYGACRMSGMAALKADAGLVTLGVPETVLQSFASSLKELMCVGLKDEDGICSGRDSEAVLKALVTRVDSIAIGPGFSGTVGELKLLSLLLRLAEPSDLPVVIDAGGLSCLTMMLPKDRALGKNVVLTPHPGEMSRLTGLSVSDIQSDRLGAASRLASDTGSWVVLKGARTIIVSPEGQSFVNPAATSALATAGSGDVLTGVLTAFLSKGIPIGEAVKLAVFVHGICGERLDSGVGGGAVGVCAGDIIEQLPGAIQQLLNYEVGPVSLVRRVLPASM